MKITLLEEDVDFNWTDQIVLSLCEKKTPELVPRQPFQGAKPPHQLPSFLTASTCMLNQVTSPRYTGWCYSAEISASNDLSGTIKYIRLQPEALQSYA